jgi:hypothetical protein
VAVTLGRAEQGVGTRACVVCVCVCVCVQV